MGDSADNLIQSSAKTGWLLRWRCKFVEHRVPEFVTHRHPFWQICNDYIKIFLIEERNCLSERYRFSLHFEGGFGLYVTDGDAQRLGGWSKQFIGRL